MEKPYLVWTSCQRPGMTTPDRIMAHAHNLNEAERRRDRWACGGFCARRHYVTRKKSPA